MKSLTAVALGQKGQLRAGQDQKGWTRQGNARKVEYDTRKNDMRQGNLGTQYKAQLSNAI